MVKKEIKVAEIEKNEEIFENDTIIPRAVYSTGFRNIDTNIAFNSYDDDGNVLKLNRGVLSGSVIGYIGVSGAGKSTLAAQHVSNMMRPFIRKQDYRVKCYIIDIEKGLFFERFKSLSNLTDNEIMRHFFWEDDNTFERLREVTERIIREKQDLKPDITIDTRGKESKIYYPSFILVDAISELLPAEYTGVDSKDSNMMYMHAVKEMDNYFKKYKNQFTKYNINLLYISHVAKKFQDNPMVRNTRDFKTMKADEKINGGRILHYASDLGLYINRIVAPTREDMEKKSLGYLDANFIVSMQMWKNRQGREGAEIYLVAGHDGFSPYKSFIYECTQNGIIKAAGATRTIVGYDKKLRGADIIKGFSEDQELRKALFTAYDEEKKYIFEGNKKNAEERKAILDVLDMMNEEF